VFCTTALFTWKLDATDVSRMAGHANCRGTGPGAGQAGQREHRRAEHGAGHDRGQRGGQGQLRGTRAAGLEHEDRAGEAEQAHPQVAPQPELVEQAQRLRDRLGQGPRDLGTAVTGDGDEGVFPVGGRGGHGSLPTPALPGTGSDGRWRG